MNGTSSKRSRVITAVSTPLGFFVLALLIVEAFLATVLLGARLDAGQKITGMWLGIILFLIVTGAVFALVWFKPQSLTFDKEAHLIDSGKVYGNESNVVENPEHLPSDRMMPPDQENDVKKGGEK
jgi:4-amino-4-deoxy-L-arabinose transferase-like glycosyltransferase